MPKCSRWALPIVSALLSWWSRGGASKSRETALGPRAVNKSLDEV